MSTSRKEARVLTPGGGGDVEDVEDPDEVEDVVEEVDAVDDAGEGGGGGGGYGELEARDAVGVGLRGAVTPGTAASFRRDSILSLYADLSSEMSFKPSCFALDSSFSRYFAMTRSWAL